MPSSRGHEADARSKRQVFATDAGGIQRLLAIIPHAFAQPVSPQSAVLSRPSVIAAGVFLTIGIALQALAADPNEKTTAAEESCLAQTAAKEEATERLDAIGRLSEVATA